MKPSLLYRRDLILACLLAVFLTGQATQSASAETLGLYVENGVLMKDGKPFRGIGVNYFDAFSRTLEDPEDTSYGQGFNTLRTTYGIPFVRFMACGFWPNDWSLYQTDKARYFALMDAFVKEAEKQQIGLIPSLFWYYSTVPDLVGEPMDQWGNPQSETHRFMRTYVNEVVGRYKHSPAIWAWEFGNEYRLGIDLPGPEQGVARVVPKLGTPEQRTPRDKMARKYVDVAQQEFAQAVRAIDPHRLLGTGDAIPRSSAYHLKTSGEWTADTRAEWTDMLRRDNLDPFGCISIHAYPLYDRTYFPEKADLHELLRVCNNTAQAAGKPLFLGEFGASHELDETEERKFFQTFLDAIEELNIPLAAAWVYDFPQQKLTYSITATNKRAYMLEALRDANQRIQNKTKLAQAPKPSGRTTKDQSP